MDLFGGYLTDAAATVNCSYCRLTNTNAFLTSASVNPDDAWRNFGLMWVYIFFNLAMAIFLYWLGRVPKSWNSKTKEIVTMTPDYEGPPTEKSTPAPSSTPSSGDRTTAIEEISERSTTGRNYVQPHGVIDITEH
jgi:hypothetical protein